MITAFLLGLMGSLHCAGMCGPLVLMTPVVGNGRSAILASRVLFHVGRVATYGAIGLLFGLVGESLIFAGVQRWLSLIVGVLMLLVLLLAIPFKSSFTRIPLSIKSLFGHFLRKRSYASIFALGAANGLLPCGLVYMAATASIAAGSVHRSMLYMLLFGFGTLPMLLAISAAGVRLSLVKISLLQKIIPVAIASVAILLILRSDPISLLQNQPAPTCPACQNHLR